MYCPTEPLQISWLHVCIYLFCTICKFLLNFELAQRKFEIAKLCANFKMGIRFQNCVNFQNAQNISMMSGGNTTIDYNGLSNQRTGWDNSICPLKGKVLDLKRITMHSHEFHIIHHQCNTITATITGARVNRRAGLGLGVPCFYKHSGPKVYVDCAKELLGNSD